MPGIAGIISRKPAADCERLVQAMVTAMAHERFYRTGTYAVPALGVYAGWTVPEHSFAEHQVFLNEDQAVALVFSGECFLDGQVEALLRQKGHDLGGDRAGWLVHLYEEYGADFFEKLNGLFSGLLIDRRTRRAFLFNDRYGVQRVYYHEDGDDFYFASEAKALLRILPALRDFDADGVAEFLVFGCTLDDRSLFKGIRRLPGAARWTFGPDGCRRETYFSPETWESQPLLSEPEYEARFQATFNRILPQYFESASKIGIALTGGLDTRMILAGRPDGGLNQITYTFTGPSRQTLDDKIAVRAARAVGLEHRLLRLEPDFFAGFGAQADKTVYVTDGCSGISGAHEIYFNQQARALAPVRLTGNYGSEVLRGVSMLKAHPLAPGLLNPEWAGRAATVKPRLAEYKKNPVTAAVTREIPWYAFGNLMAGWSQVSFRTPYLDNEVVALAYQAATATRYSSLPALRYIKAASPVMSRIPTDRGFIGDEKDAGYIFRRALAEVTFKLEYYNIEGLPKKVSLLNPAYRLATGLMGLEGLHKFLRYSSWYRRPLRAYLTERLASPTAWQGRFWEARFIKAMAEQHISGRQNYSHEINKVLTLETIERVLFRDLPR